jgi:hypothetical protein
MMKRSVEMIYAWIQAMEDAQPEYGDLLSITVTKVGYPAIDQMGVIRTIHDGRLVYGMACGYMQGCASARVEIMKNQVLGKEYPKLQAANDKEGMALALAKWKFYETFDQWIRSNDAQEHPMDEDPEWLSPFVPREG